MNSRNRQLVAYYKKEGGGCCQKCGYDKSIPALDFHHISKEQKERNPVTVIISNNHEITVKELDKCVLLCANCHREYTAGLWVSEFVKRNGLGWAVKPGTVTETSYDEYDRLSDKYRYAQMTLIS